METRSLRLGILGSGRVVQRRMIPAIRSQTDVQLVAVASERSGVAAEVAREHSIPRSFEGYESLLADPQIDAVYVPTRGREHYRWVLAAAQAGKHVLCEKPLACNLQEAEEMVEACRSAGVVLQEAFMWRSHPRATRTRELVEEGAIGSPRIIVVSFSFSLDPNDWRMDSTEGGGALFDLGSYGIDAARYFLREEPTDIAAMAHHSARRADVTTQLSMRFSSGAIAGVDCSFEAPFRCRAEIVGTAGRIVLHEAFQPTGQSVISLQRSADRDAPVETITVPPADQYATQLALFAASVRKGALVAPAEDGLANMRVLDQAMRMLAARSGS